MTDRAVGIHTKFGDHLQGEVFFMSPWEANLVVEQGDGLTLYDFEGGDTPLDSTLSRYFERQLQLQYEDGIQGKWNELYTIIKPHGSVEDLKNTHSMHEMLLISSEEDSSTKPNILTTNYEALKREVSTTLQTGKVTTKLNEYLDELGFGYRRDDAAGRPIYVRNGEIVKIPTKENEGIPGAIASRIRRTFYRSQSK